MLTSPNDVHTTGYVLHRTNYGEADRILNLITPLGKFSVIARSVRKAKSKLAGAIEPFTLSEFNIHQGHQGLSILTSAKMLKFHGAILKDFDRLNLAAKILQHVNATSENTNSGDFFQLVDQSLTALAESTTALGLIEAWFLINLKRISGEELNFYRDTSDQKLIADQTYRWDSYERAFTPTVNGDFDTATIKLLRLMSTNPLPLIQKIRLTPQLLSPIMKLVREL